MYCISARPQEPDVLNYHVIPKELLFPEHLSDGTLKSTLLGQEYQVHFHFNDKNQVPSLLLCMFMINVLLL